MSWREAWRRRSPLTRRLIVGTILFSSAITLVLTVYQLYRDYQTDLDVIEGNLARVEDVHLPTIAESLWATDEARLQLQLEGILRLRDMHFLEIREGEQQWAKVGQLSSHNVITRSIPITYLHDGKLLTIGTLTAVATLDGVYQRLFDKALIILLSNGLKTFLVAGFLVVFFHRLIARHLLNIGTWVKDREHAPPLALDRASTPLKADELDGLVAALNADRETQRRVLAELAAERQRYESLFENANDMILIVEPGSGRILGANARASALTGYARHELLAMTVKQIGAPDTGQQVDAAMKRLADTGHALFERTLMSKDGRVFPAEVSSRVVEIGGERVIESFVRDLTERQRAEKWRSHQNRILEMLLAGAELSAVLATVVRFIESEIDGVIGSVLLLDEDGRRLRHGAAPNLPAEYNRAIDGGQIGPAAGSCGTAAFQGKPVIVENIASDPLWRDYREIAARFNLRACWSQPVFSAAGEVLGTFAMYYREPRRPTAEELRLIEEAGKLVAVVIEAARNRGKLADSEARFRATFEQAAVGIAHVAPDGRWLRINQKLCDIVGYTHEEMLARTFQSITHPDDLATDLKHVRQLLAGEIPSYSMEKRYIRKNGEIVWINLTVALVRTAERAPDYFISVIEDVSTRKRTEAALHEREEVLRLFVAHSPAAIAMLDDKMRYIAVSRRWLSDYGLGDRDLAGLSHYDVFPEVPQRWRDVHRRCLAGATERSDEDAFERADGRREWVKWEVCPWRKSDGRIGGIIVFSELVTERKRAEAALDRSHHQLETLSRRLLSAQETERRRIARELHDEIGQLLTVVKLDLQTVLRKSENPALTPALKEGMASIDRAVARVRDLSLNLRPSMLDDLGLVPALRWFVQRQAQHLHLDIALKLPRGEPRLPNEIETACFRVAQEALTNAARHAKASHIDVALEQRKEAIELTVRDNGAGFDVDAMQLRQVAGEGFGLLGMEERVELAGGEFQLFSTPGRGTTIKVTFPIAAVRQAAP